jgi:solute:Na+ symporter, SSS family
MLPAIVVFLYLAIVLYVGIFAFRRSRGGAEDFFLANRSLGPFVFLLSLFGSNMTAFSILGSSGLSFRIGIGVFGLMASISAIIIPLSLFLIGTRLWSIGKRFGHMTQVQIFRDRWEMKHTGTLIFALEAVMLVPYIIIGVMGGGETLEGISSGTVPYWLGGLIVALVVMSYVFFGGMRGTAWVNTLQTLMFLIFGTIAFALISHAIGGFSQITQQLASGPEARLLARSAIPKGLYLSYALIPLSSIMFPHIAIFCLTAQKMSSFRRTVIFYPICIMLTWLPAIFLGVMAAGQPRVVSALAAKSAQFASFKNEDPAAADLVLAVADGSITSNDHDYELLQQPPLKQRLKAMANSTSDGVMLQMLSTYAPGVLAGVLGALIMACVMASDSQILALSTMWAEDVYHFYGGQSETARVWSARAFVVICTIVAYTIALSVRQFANIFDLAVQYAFSGYTALAPLMLAALFWKGSTKHGALAATLWVIASLLFVTWLQWHTQTIAPANPAAPPNPIPNFPTLYREVNRISFTQQRFLIVLPMFIGSALLMWLVSLFTKKPSPPTIARYFQ